MTTSTIARWVAIIVFVFSLIDMNAGMWLVTGILAALFERGKSGHRQRVETSLRKLECRLVTNAIWEISVGQGA